METVLVVDDARVDQRLAGRLLEQDLDVHVVYAENGKRALEVIKANKPDLVITDMLMPEMDGLELTEAIRAEYPALPVIVMTALGSEELAADALKKGATSYLPKRRLAQDLAHVVRRQFALASTEQLDQEALEYLDRLTSYYTIDNEPLHIVPVVRLLQNDLARLRLCTVTTRMRIGVALEEAVNNAIHHGNFELDSGLRDNDPVAYNSLFQERQSSPPFSDRRVHIRADVTRRQATYVVKDDGEGFDWRTLPDASDPANLEKNRNRGLTLVKTFMDEVHHNDKGNEITMIKYRETEGD
jgi:CheY-like chemotaxis protein/anti-sigma regulatory factor (Ser/Thr protein kinase)